MARKLPFAPIGAIIAEQAALRATDGQEGYTLLAAELGFDESQMRRWAKGTYSERPRSGPNAGKLVEKRFETISLDAADRITTGLGIRLDELYPELDVELEPDAWCSTCAETVAPVHGVCPWCEAKITGALKPDAKATLRDREPQQGPGTGAKTNLTEPLVRAAMRAYIAEPQYTAAARAVAATTTHPYRDDRQFANALRNHFLRRGWWTPADVERALTGDVMRRPVKYRGTLSPELLREARRLYEDEGMGFLRIARQLHPQTTAATVNSLCNSLHHAWKVHGWPTRDRVEATRLASWKHGRKVRAGHDEGAYRRWFKETHGLYQPTCEGTLTGRGNPADAGRPCTKPTLTGGRFCAQHDPERQAEHAARLARMRAERDERRGPMLPTAPIGAWLDGLCAERGTTVVAEQLGVHKSRIHQLRRGKVKTISRARAQEMLDILQPGLTVDDLTGLRAIPGGRTPDAGEPEAIAA